MTTRDLHWRIGDREVACRIDDSHGHGTFAVDGGRRVPFRVLDDSHIEIDGARLRFYVVHKRDVSMVWLDGRTYEIRRARKTAAVEDAAALSSGEIRTLMPGKLLRVHVVQGEVVKEKQTVAIMESMKMESPLVAPKAGRVSEIRFKPGDVLDMGQVVAVIEDD